MTVAIPARLSGALARRTGLRLFRLFSRKLGTDAPPLAGLALRMVRKDDALAHCADPELDLRAAGVEQAFARGDLCVGAYEGSRLAGYCWLALSPLPHLDGVWVDFGPHAVWTYKSLVRPSYRGRGIAPALYRFADGACRQRGRSQSLLCVEAHNTPSIAAGLRAGYASSGWAGWLRRENSVRAWYSPAATQHGLRFYLP
jgi:GNAT superfamily N-acetyltransferase